MLEGDVYRRGIFTRNDYHKIEKYQCIENISVQHRVIDIYIFTMKISTKWWKQFLHRKREW